MAAEYDMNECIISPAEIMAEKVLLVSKTPRFSVHRRENVFAGRKNVLKSRNEVGNIPLHKKPMSIAKLKRCDMNI